MARGQGQRKPKPMNLFHQVLQVTPHADAYPGFISRLADQAFSIVLLVLAVYWFARRANNQDKQIKEMNEKLERYMTQDRVSVQEALNRSTKVMESLENLLKAPAMRTSIILFLILALTGCARTKRVARSEATATESYIYKDTASHQHVSGGGYSRIVRDTAITVAERSLQFQLQATDVRPAQTADGIAVARNYYRQADGLRAAVTVLPNGSVDVQCQADSLRLVVAGLITETTAWRDCTQYWKHQYAVNRIFNRQQEYVSKRLSVSVWLWIGLFVAILLGVLWMLVKTTGRA